MAIPHWATKPSRPLRYVYDPCPLHPDAPIRRDQVPGHDKRGRPETQFIAVCAECGQRLEKKSAAAG